MVNLEVIATPAQKRALTAEIKAQQEYIAEARSCTVDKHGFYWHHGEYRSTYYIVRLELELSRMLKRRAKMNTNVNHLNY